MLVHRLEETELDPIRIAFSTAVPMNAHNCNNRVLKTKLGQLYHTLLHERSIVSELYVSSYAMSPQPYVQAERERQHNGIEVFVFTYVCLALDSELIQPIVWRIRTDWTPSLANRICVALHVQRRGGSLHGRASTAA